MSVRIGIEDLAANALIEVLERSNNQEREISVSQLWEYGMAIVSELNHETNDEYICIFSRDAFSSFVHDYTDYFNIREHDDERYISKKEKVSLEELKDVFRSYLSVDMLVAFVSKSSLQKLGIG